jgi:uncharacterized protein (TIGR03083 family)
VKVSLLQELEAERGELFTLLEGLTPEQWEHPTLCTAWRVRDVAAHVISYDVPTGRILAYVLANRTFRPTSPLDHDRMNRSVLAPWEGLPTNEILAGLRSCLEPTGFRRLLGPRLALCDVVIHQQDIRRPLNMPRQIPAVRLTTTLDVLLHHPLYRSYGKRCRGLRLVGLDAGWAAGKGPVIEGPAEALALAIAGGRTALSDLKGDGLDIFVSRLP